MDDNVVEKIINKSKYAPCIVAEMSGNHNQSLERALRIVDAAAKAGVQALKIQTYTADTMTIDSQAEGFVIKDKASLWEGQTLYDLYKKAATPWQWHKPIFKKCKKLGIIGFSTPFDETAVDFLESLNVPCYKVSSFELVDLPLIRKIARTKKPIILSTGMATIVEIEEAIKTAKKAGCKDLILLKCTSAYPAEPDNSNILTIPDMRKRFGCQIGLSDHTLGVGVALTSIALGARIIEKHFTLSRAEGGVDAAFSMDPTEMAMLVSETKRAWQSLGGIKYGPNNQEKISLKYRRSLYFVKDLNKGDCIDRTNIRAIRSGLGLAPKYYEDIIGKRVCKNVKRGMPVKMELLFK